MLKRKQKVIYDLIQDAVRDEFMTQASSIVEQLAYDYMKNNCVATDKVTIETHMSNCSFELYAVYESTALEIAHYHREDCLWVATNQERVYEYLGDAFKRFFKCVAENIVIDERM